MTDGSWHQGNVTLPRCHGARRGTEIQCVPLDRDRCPDVAGRKVRLAVLRDLPRAATASEWNAKLFEGRRQLAALAQDARDELACVERLRASTSNPETMATFDRCRRDSSSIRALATERFDPETLDSRRCASARIDEAALDHALIGVGRDVASAGNPTNSGQWRSHRARDIAPPHRPWTAGIRRR